MRKPGRIESCLLVACVCLTIIGCSRHWHRLQADRDAGALIHQKGGYLDNGNLAPPPDSRLFDPYSEDCPPIPIDDPQSARLMKCVDGKRGYEHWYDNGVVASVDPMHWIEALPKREDGTVQLDLRDTVRIARVNSRDYQQNLETLYRSSLDVAFERFRFDHQFFAGNVTRQAFRGRDVGATSPTTVDSFAGFTKLGPTGAELLVGFANSLVWDSWGSDTDLFSSTVDFTLVQPLLRFGGRARVLEQLTQSERNLLANVRQMEQFRQGFYVGITTGRNTGSGPSLGNNIGQSGLGLIAGFPSGRTGAPDAGGYLGLLQDQQQIRNQAANIAALRDSEAQLNASFDANRISSRLQVDQARQALLNAQSSLLSARAAYDTRLDGFKIQLGLPPTLPVEIKDPLLDRFMLIDPALTELQDDLGEILGLIRRGRDNPAEQLLNDSLRQIASLDERVDLQVNAAIGDFDALKQFLPERRDQLRLVGAKVQDLNADVDPRVYDEQRLLDRVAYLEQRLPAIATDFADVRAVQIDFHRDNEPIRETWKRVNAHATRLSDLLLELSLLQAETRLQAVVLQPLELDPQEAVEFARLNRLDWMNARANLVDVWRKIEFFANDLKSDLDLVIDGQVGTKPDNVIDFDADRSRIRFGVEFDTPTARVAERVRYRESLIDYQQARRDYLLFEDRVAQSLRNTLRIVTLSQINLEVRRTAVQVAIAQVDNARLRLNPPLRPDQQNRASPTAARDLVSALADLLDAQNDFLNVWVSNEVQRVLVDFEMGTMQLDPTGIWIDPGPIEKPQPIEAGGESWNPDPPLVGS